MPEVTTQLEFKVYLRKPDHLTARQIRRENLIPAVVYGPGQKTLHLSMDLKSAEKFSKKEYENKIFTFKSDEKTLDGLKVLKKEASYHILTRKPQHIDFLSLDMNKKVRVHVEVIFTGKSKGVKESGGVLNIICRQVEVECLPGQIPESLSIDVSPLEVNQNFHVSDLNIPKGIKLITASSAVLCAVIEIAEEEEKQASGSDSDGGAESPPSTKGEKTDPATEKTPATKTPAAKTKTDKVEKK